MREPLAGISPYARLAIAGIGIIIGVALMFVGIRTFAGDEPTTPDTGVITPTTAGG